MYWCMCSQVTQPIEVTMRDTWIEQRHSVIHQCYASHAQVSECHVPMRVHGGTEQRRRQGPFDAL
jgi:hypothetical protein